MIHLNDALGYLLGFAPQPRGVALLDVLVGGVVNVCNLGHMSSPGSHGGGGSMLVDVGRVMRRREMDWVWVLAPSSVVEGRGGGIRD